MQVNLCKVSWEGLNNPLNFIVSIFFSMIRGTKFVIKVHIKKSAMVFKCILTYKLHNHIQSYCLCYDPWSRIQKYARIGSLFCFCFVGFIFFFVSLRVDLKQHAGKVCIWELEMPLVIELVECRTERVVVFQMKVVHFGFRCSEATIFTHIHL